MLYIDVAYECVYIYTVCSIQYKYPARVAVTSRLTHPLCASTHRHLTMEEYNEWCVDTQRTGYICMHACA